MMFTTFWFSYCSLGPPGNSGWNWSSNREDKTDISYSYSSQHLFFEWCVSSVTVSFFCESF